MKELETNEEHSNKTESPILLTRKDYLEAMEERREETGSTMEFPSKQLSAPYLTSTQTAQVDMESIQDPIVNSYQEQYGNGMKGYPEYTSYSNHAPATSESRFFRNIKRNRNAIFAGVIAGGLVLGLISGTFMVVQSMMGEMKTEEENDPFKEAQKKQEEEKKKADENAEETRSKKEEIAAANK